MPNWVENNLTITGDKDSLIDLRERMRTPYESEFYNYKDNCVEKQVVEGEFLLWNAKRPIDLDAYYQRDKIAQQIAERANPTKPEITAEEIGKKLTEAVERMGEEMQSGEFLSKIEEIQEEFKTGMDWYNWNVRNWGTKWELSNADVSESETSLSYYFESAWSPPVEALVNLSKMYPDLQFRMEGLDENFCFAYEVLIKDGELEDRDVPMDHNLRMKYRDWCDACSGEAMDDPDYEEERIEYGCYEARLEGLDFEVE